MLATIRLLIAHAGDMSNLILNPDLNTYCLIDATLMSLPPEQDQLINAIDDGESFLSRPDAATASDPVAAMQAGILRDSDRDHIVNDVDTSLREYSVFYGTSPELQRLMPPARDAYAAAMTRSIDLIQSLAKPNANRPMPAAYRDVMEAGRAVIGDEINQLARNVDHIKHIVAAQRSFAKAGGSSEEVDLVELIEDSLRINGLKNGTDGIELICDFQHCGPAVVDKHKLLQILANFISNAKKAVADADLSVRRITASLSQCDDDHHSMARIRVTDTGVGISPENLKRIFQHRFTTRKDGHGFGLHAAANDANAMGGSVSVSSTGSGAGATFTLEIPLGRAEVVQR